jgi:hypothetical protein
MYSSSPVDFHFIADPVSQAYLETSFKLVKEPAVAIRCFFYPLSIEAMKARLARTASPTPEVPRYGELGSGHQAGTRTSAASSNTPDDMLIYSWHDEGPSGVRPSMYSADEQLFIHELLPTTVSHAMFVDSDAFFVTDPTRKVSYYLTLVSIKCSSLTYRPLAGIQLLVTRNDVGATDAPRRRREV